MLERKLDERAQGRQRPFLVRRRPDAQLALRHAEPSAEHERALAAHEHVDVADVVGLEHDRERRRARVQSFPDRRGVSGGASGSSRAISPPDSTHVDVTVSG